MLLAGIAGFKSPSHPANASASFLRDWIENGHFTWLVSEDILDEYKAVLASRNVRRQPCGASGGQSDSSQGSDPDDRASEAEIISRLTSTA